MAYRYSTALFVDFVNAIKTGMADGVLMFYSSSQPSGGPDAAPTGSYIGKATLAGGAWTAGTATNGLEFGTAVAVGNSSATINKASAEDWRFVCENAGTIGWCRYVGNPVDNNSVSTTLRRIDMSCGVGSGDLMLTRLTFAVGESLSVSDFLLTLGNTA